MNLINNLAIMGIRKTTDTAWQINLIRELDEMADSFLGFPASVPQSFQNYQFARHLIWKLTDNQRHFRRLFLQGVTPKDLDIFWLRLMPFITGDMPESLSSSNPKVIRLSLRMYDIVRDVAIDHRYNVDRLMDRVVEAIRSIRSITTNEK